MSNRRCGNRCEVLWYAVAPACLVFLLPMKARTAARGGRDSALRPDSCVLEARHSRTLGDLADAISVVVPMEAYVASVPWGGWLVTEDANDVIEYSAAGDFRRTFGRRGKGPGELDLPNAVAVDPTDSVWISDPRGRVVVYGPDGRPARTLLRPDVYQIEGFTESGLPYAVLTKVDRIRGALSAWRYVQLWNRDGEPLTELGPGHFAATDHATTVNEFASVQGVMLGDSVAVVPAGWQDWLTYWAVDREWAAVPADAVWRVLDLDGAPESESDGRPIALAGDSVGGYWVLGIVRRLSTQEEDRLVQQTRGPRGESAQIFRRQSPGVTNATFDGVILHVDVEGTITSGDVFDEYPRGFTGDGQFYTFVETELGLVQIHIWDFGQRCSRSPGEV